ncbi:MAG: Hsp20/alpha crystallin family protein [Bacilli bacterium]
MSRNEKNYLVDSDFDLTDHFFDDFFEPFGMQVNHRNRQVMRTDVSEEGDHYELQIDVPLIKKENIKISLDNGYLTVSAMENSEKEDNKQKKYIRRERYCGNYSRSFYVGANIKEEDINAKLDQGVLTLSIPKETKTISDKKYIEIE